MYIGVHNVQLWLHTLWNYWFLCIGFFWQSQSLQLTFLHACISMCVSCTDTACCPFAVVVAACGCATARCDRPYPMRTPAATGVCRFPGSRSLVAFSLTASCSLNAPWHSFHGVRVLSAPPAGRRTRIQRSPSEGAGPLGQQCPSY